MNEGDKNGGERRHSPTPAHHHVAHQDTAAGKRQRVRPGEPRVYWCRSCGKEETSTDVPTGWYLLSRAAKKGENRIRLGVYCSVGCLSAQLPRIAGVAEKMAERGDGP